MYKRLAKYYDALLKDDEAVSWWTDFTNKHSKGKTILELASGTGEISLSLAKDYDLDASDLSIEMLDEIKAKDVDNKIKSIKQLNMLDLAENNKYDNVICYCDSINYLDSYESLEMVVSNVYKALKDGGVFLFDMHTPDRLVEFEEPYIEVGLLHGTDYQWSITSEDDFIYHHFAFYEDELIQENHTQRVFDYNKVLEILNNIGFTVKVYTDFDTEGISEGEKYFIVANKK